MLGWWDFLRMQSALLVVAVSACGGATTGGTAGAGGSGGGFVGLPTKGRGGNIGSGGAAADTGTGGVPGCSPMNCQFTPTCFFGEVPVTLPGECCPTQCALSGVTDAAACFGIPCVDTHGCWCAGGIAEPGIACGASGTCVVCSTNGLNDPCLGGASNDCCAGLQCVNNRCVQ